MMLAARSAVLPPDWPRRRREAPTVESRPEGGKDENGNRSIFDDVDE
jgi:hypothetical protein